VTLATPHTKTKCVHTNTHTHTHTHPYYRDWRITREATCVFSLSLSLSLSLPLSLPLFESRQYYEDPSLSHLIIRVKTLEPHFFLSHARVMNILLSQHTATRCNTLQHTWHTATHCNMPDKYPSQPTHCNTLQHIATHLMSIHLNKHTATHCNTLQHT